MSQAFLKSKCFEDGFVQNLKMSSSMIWEYSNLCASMKASPHGQCHIFSYLMCYIIWLQNGARFLQPKMLHFKCLSTASNQNWVEVFLTTDLLVVDVCKKCVFEDKKQNHRGLAEPQYPLDEPTTGSWSQTLTFVSGLLNTVPLFLGH